MISVLEKEGMDTGGVWASDKTVRARIMFLGFCFDADCTGYCAKRYWLASLTLYILTRYDSC